MGRRTRLALLKPNNFGLFDTLGNLLEWCQDGLENANDMAKLLPNESEVKDSNLRIMRGAMYLNLAQHMRTAHRLDRKTTRQPNDRDFVFGFRPVRTFR